MRGLIGAVALVAALAGVATRAPAQEQPAIAGAVAARLALAAPGKGDPTGDLAPFYAGRAHAPIWVGDLVAVGRAAALLDALRRADTEGLDPADYRPDALAAMLAASDPADLARAELELSRTLLAYANDVGCGQVDPAEVETDIHLAPPCRTVEEVLGAAAATTDIGPVLRGLPPRTPQYDRLRQTLARLKALDAAGGFGPPVPEDAAPLKPGMQGEAVAALRSRLIATGDLTVGAGEPATFDDVLEAGLRRFQARHGLDVDGIAGKGTLAAVNVETGARIEEVWLNMERRRWMPVDLGRRYVFVNLADFELKVVDGERTIHTDRVVVGKPFTRTPVFSRAMTGIVVNPYWNVPPSIALGEMLPRLRQDPGYLGRNGLTLLGPGDRPVDPWTVDWAKLGPGRFPYRVRQDPGARNALGRLKFDLPNPWSIYLHDTPAKALFDRSARSFSHGCIRVNHPVALAALLLGPQGWSTQRLEAAIDSDRQQAIRLADDVPVHITYLTAWTDKDGTVQFRGDVYGRDAELRRALQSLRR